MVAASFDGGGHEWFSIFWDSDSAGGFFKGTTYNETITRVLLPCPPAATNVKLTVRLLQRRQRLVVGRSIILR